MSPRKVGVARLAFRSLGVLLRSMPTARLEAMLLSIINAKADFLAADEGLRFLFRLDARLYESQNRLAVRHGQGTHPKHRLTAYHDFFVERISAGERVLDVGCGHGQLAHALASKAKAVVEGIDLVPSNIAKARSLPPVVGLSFRVGDALEDLPNAVFDTVVLSNVLEHLPDRAAFLRRLVATTKARRLLIRVPLFERDWRVPLKRDLGVEWRSDPTHLTEHTHAAFVAELDEAGLEVAEEKIRWGEIWSVVREKA